MKQSKMYRLIAAIIAVTFGVILHESTGYKWVTLSSNDSIPKNAIRLNNYFYKFVGRAIHYNLVLPAEVYNSTHAFVLYNSNELVKNQFEVLVATERCEWKRFREIKEVPETVVRAGTAWNNEPIYIGKTESYSNRINIASILFGSNDVIEWDSVNIARYALVCEDNTTWVDGSSGSVPANAVLGGTFLVYEYFVARLLGPISFVPGQVCPQQDIAITVYDKYEMRSRYCQVLVGDSSEYTWYSANSGYIPDYAVVGGRFKNNELMYIARFSNYSIAYIVHSEAIASPRVYDILVKIIN